MQEELFEHSEAPLAVRLRPSKIDDLLGQQHLLQDGAPLRRLINGEAKHITSVLLYGPPLSLIHI